MATCNAVAAQCRCSRLEGHDGPHHCTEDRCGGQWFGEIDTPSFDVVRFPMDPFDPPVVES